jgi:hypothetical protein
MPYDNTSMRFSETATTSGRLTGREVSIRPRESTQTIDWEELREPGMPEDLRPTCELIGTTDGNAFTLIGTVRMCLKRAGYPEKANEFSARAMEGDYDHVLRTIMEYVEVTGPDAESVVGDTCIDGPLTNYGSW